MTYESERSSISRTPQSLAVITLDYCSRVFGTSPCLATGVKCYNTWSTCKYTSAYVNIGKAYEFSRKDRPLIGHGIRPYLLSETELPTVINPEKGIAVNSRLTLKFRDDENDTDVGVDPYVSSRSSVQGSYFKKLLARNRFYLGRTVEVKKGFAGLDKSLYLTRFKGVIDKVVGPVNGVFEMVVKDYLKKADNVLVPVVTKGKITDNPLSAGAVTLNLADATEYTATGWVRLEDEVIKYTGKSGNQLTGLTRGQFNTLAVQHDLDTAVQQCAVWQATNAWDIINDILQSRVGMAAADIDTVGAAAERDTWHQGLSFTACISKPKKASELIQELCEQCYSVIWWDQESQLVRFKVNAPAVPGSTVKSLTDTDTITGSRHTDHNEKSRLSRVIVYYNRKAEGRDDEPDDYLNRVILWDVNKEGANEYAEPAPKEIFSRWITDEPTATVLANRFLVRFGLPPKKLSFALELKDDELKAGDLCKVTTRDILNIDGTEVERTYQVLKKEPKGPNQIVFTALDTAFDRTYSVIGPASMDGIDWDSATPEQKEYGFIGDANNKLGVAKEDGFYIW